MAKKLNDLLAISLFLIGIFIFMISFRENGLIKLIGLAGSICLIISQGYFFWQIKKK